MLTWHEDFATGSLIVDTQHRMLIERINQIEWLLKGPPPSKTSCDELFDFLGFYAATHFKFEEDCMERTRCPVHARNKEAHAAFLDVFGRFKQRYLAEGPRPDLLRSLQNTASEWIKSHILTIDVHLRTCLKD